MLARYSTGAILIEPPAQEPSEVNDEDVVMGRRSIRGFKPQPVERQVIEEVIELATRAPSSMNTQP